jgi:hypothetical protein
VVSGTESAWRDDVIETSLPDVAQRPTLWYSPVPEVEMDAITTAIVAALGKLAEPAVKDAYDGLKRLIVRKLTPTHQSVADSIEHLERKPDSETRQADLSQELEDAALTAHGDLLEKARELLTLTGQSPMPSTQTVIQKVSGERNIVAGIGSVVVDRQRRRT